MAKASPFRSSSLRVQILKLLVVRLLTEWGPSKPIRCFCLRCSVIWGRWKTFLSRLIKTSLCRRRDLTPIRCADILALGRQWTQRITGNAFRIFLQPDWQNDNSFFNRPIMARTQILVHRWGLQKRFRRCFADRLNQNSGNRITVTFSPGPFEIHDGIPAPAMQPTILYLKGSKKSPGHNNPGSHKNGNKIASYLFFEFIQLLW